MKIVKWALGSLIGLAVLLVLAGRLGLLAGTPPRTLGVSNGRLQPPSMTPNSVSSQADLYPDHPRRNEARIAPLGLVGGNGGNGEATMTRLTDIVGRSSGAKIITRHDDYLYAEFTTPALRFTDDVEFWLDRANGVIQVRSASRLGQSDMGTNRKRIEAIRAQLAAG